MELELPLSNFRFHHSYGGKVSIRDRFGATPWDSVQNNYADNQELKRIVKQAFDLEENKRIKVRLTLRSS